MLLLFAVRGSPFTDVPLVHDDRLDFRIEKEVGDRAFDPGVVVVFVKHSCFPLDWSGRLAEHLLQRAAGMVTIFGMNQIETVASNQLFRQVSEKFAGRRTPV